MYIAGSNTYYAGTEQRASRGYFLLLLQQKDGPHNAEGTYACVRRVALRQLGHFMMGRVNLGGKWHTVSGAYGNDGLPMDVEKLPSDAKPLPSRLYDMWNRGGGHNGVGNEALDMRDWARRVFKIS